MWFARFALVLVWIGCPIAVAAQNASEIEKAADVMVRLCVGGGRTEAKSSGGAGEADLSLRSLDAKGNIKGDFKISKSSAEGLVNGLDNALSQVAADQADKVRACLQPVRERLLDVMLPAKKEGSVVPHFDLDDPTIQKEIYSDLSGYLDTLPPEQRAKAQQLIFSNFGKYLGNFKQYLNTLNSQQKLEAQEKYSASVMKYISSLSREQHSVVRDQIYRNFSLYLDTLPPQERLKIRENYTRLRLERANITVADLKRILNRIGYQQPINDTFDSKLTDTIILLQKDYGFEADGICGEICLGKIIELAHAACGTRPGEYPICRPQ